MMWRLGAVRTFAAAVAGAGRPASLSIPISCHDCQRVPGERVWGIAAAPAAPRPTGGRLGTATYRVLNSLTRRWRYPVFAARPGGRHADGGEVQCNGATLCVAHYRRAQIIDRVGA